MSRPAPLRCWWDGVHVADFTGKVGWDLRCAYRREALDQYPSNLPLISCSLPLQSRPATANAFLRGLLPEGAHLQELASLAKVATNDTHALLARFGRDIAGALVFTLTDEPPDASRWSVEPYSSDSLEAEIRDLDAGLGVRDDSELSLAGLQNKLLLVADGVGGWGRPVHGHPSTHILKVDDDRHVGLVAAEAACLDIASAVGLTDIEPELLSIGDVDCLVVRRYDRRRHDGDSIERVHQEDTCQALGVVPDSHRGRGKYASHGGPTARRIASLLEVHATAPTNELEQLLRALIFTVLIGNADLHGKNLSFTYDLPGHPKLASLYDTVPTALWPKLRRELAMPIGGHTNPQDVTTGVIVDEARSWGVAARVAGDWTERAVAEIAAAASASGHQQVSALVAANVARVRQPRSSS